MSTHQHDTHPKSLRIFFATEMWERYGFYVVQSLLALYLALHFHWPDEKIYALVGSFTALTYLSPLVGGWIADHLLGQKKTILLGAMVLLISYCLLALMDNASSLSASLAAIAVGTGLLKPNISSLLGNEYPEGSSKRENGFTIFYMGITSGIILGTTLPSELNAAFGWPVAFISASVGMVIAICTFAFGLMHYAIKDYSPFVFQTKKILLAAALILCLWALGFYTLSCPKIADFIFALVVIYSATYILYSVRTEELFQARQTLIIGILCIISVMFWSFYFQMFMSLTLFIARVVEPRFLGIEFPPPYYVTMQSIGMLFFGYFLAKKQVQMKLSERGLSTAKKFLSAIILMTLAYGLIALVTNYSNPATRLSALAIIPAYLIISLAELLLSPIGLAAITALASRKKVSTMMGIFFVSLGVGGFLSGKLASLTAAPLGETNLAILKAHYASAFVEQLGICFAVSIVCIVLYAAIYFLIIETKK